MQSIIMVDELYKNFNKNDLNLCNDLFNATKQLYLYSPQYVEKITKLYEKFINNSGNITVSEKEVEVKLKKKRHLPAILSAMQNFTSHDIEWLDGKKINILAASNS